MPRKPRYILPGCPQHVIIRGVNRESIFFYDADYRYFLTRLYEAIEKYQCALHAYVLMTNHVHLLMTPEDNHGIAKSIQNLGRYYVQHFNQSYGRTGTLWEGRYKSTPVDTEQYLLICYRYIELNPVRANMTDNPANYPWSSFRHNATGQKNNLVTAHDRYLALGNNEIERQQAYRDLFETEIEEQKLKEIRAASNLEWVLGSDQFKQKIEQRLKRRTAPLTRGGDRKSSSYKSRCLINRY